MDFFRRILVRIASWFGFVALLSLILYPFFKHVYEGLAPIALGGAVAFLPSMWPANVRKRANQLTAIPERRWLSILTICGLCLRLPLILFPPRPLSDFMFYYLHGQML